MAPPYYSIFCAFHRNYGMGGRAGGLHLHFQSGTTRLHAVRRRVPVGNTLREIGGPDSSWDKVIAGNEALRGIIVFVWSRKREEIPVEFLVASRRESDEAHSVVRETFGNAWRVQNHRGGWIFLPQLHFDFWLLLVAIAALRRNYVSARTVKLRNKIYVRTRYFIATRCKFG